MLRWLASLHTDGTDVFLTPPYPKLHQTVTIRLRVSARNPIRNIYLRTAPEGEEMLTPMTLEKRDKIFAWYQVCTQMVPKLLRYRFKIVCPTRVYWYTATGIYAYTPSDQTDFSLIADFTPPHWLNGAVFYQIFPDTFCCGQSKKELWPDFYKHREHKPVLHAWGESPEDYQNSHSLDFFGGDLEGIRTHISYLQKLGVNALYLTPVFQAPSNHRYDTQDYFRIDPLLGTNEEFAGLVDALHHQGMRIILDGVFNHSGIACRWFNKERYYQEDGAYQSLASPYAEFYTFERHPEKYACWCGISSLPKLNYRSHKLREMIYLGEKSVVKFWLKAPYRIDGWRLDVANMTARQGEYQAQREVMREMRISVKSTNPDAYFMGEHFFDASDYLEGDGLDAVMNYQGFTLPVREWMTGCNRYGEASRFTAAELDKQLTEVRARLSWQVATMQYNLLNCHDLPRLRSLVNIGQNKLAALFLMTYVGIPSILYGDEIGLSGAQSSESTRRCMLWDEKMWDQELWEFYHSLITLRKQSPALQQGGFKTLYAAGDIYAYARFYQQDVRIVILNRSDREQKVVLCLTLLGLRQGDRLCEFFSGSELELTTPGQVAVTVPPWSGVLWSLRP